MPNNPVSKTPQPVPAKPVSQEKQLVQRGKIKTPPIVQSTFSRQPSNPKKVSR